MNEPLSDEELDAIDRRCAAALPGPWQSIIEGRDMTSGSSFIMTGPEGEHGEDLYLSTYGHAVSDADHDFIAAARQDVPRLLAELRRLRTLLDGPVPEEERVWIFHGEEAPFAAAVFTTEADALAWAERHQVSGIVTEYPVGDGCYDIAVERGSFTPSKPHHGTSEHIAAFSPGWTRHVHLTNGRPN